MATKKLTTLPSPGDLVFARVTGHPVWPARIQARQGEIFSVFFYGTFDLATVKAGAIYPYNEQNKAKFANHPAVIKKKVFAQAIEQIEETPEIAPVLDNNENAIVVVKKPIKKVIQSKTNSSNDLAYEEEDVMVEDVGDQEKIKNTKDIPHESLLLGKRKSLGKETLSTISYPEKRDHANATAQTSTKSGRLIKLRKMSPEVVTKSTIEATSNGQIKHVTIFTQETNCLNKSYSSKENNVKETDSLKVKGNNQKMKKNCEKTKQLKNQPELAKVKKLQERLVHSRVTQTEEVVKVLDKKALPDSKEGDSRSVNIY